MSREYTGARHFLTEPIHLAVTLATIVVMIQALGSPPLLAGEPTTIPRQPRVLQPPRGGVNQITYRDARHADKFYPININNHWGNVAQGGDIIIFPAFDWTDYRYESLIRAIVDGRTGFLRASGEFSIDPIYPYADRFAEGFAVVSDGQGKFSYINKAGRLLTDLRFDGALRFREKVAAVQIGDRIGYINKRGDWLVDPRFARARSFHSGLAAVQFPAVSPQGRGTARWAYINKTGKPQFTDEQGVIVEAGDFNNGLARVRVKLPPQADEDKPSLRWGYLNRSFKITIEPQFRDARDFIGGLAAVKHQDKWGYINRVGHRAIAPTFEQAYDFGDNDRGENDFESTLAMIRHNGRFGFVNRVGELTIAPQFKKARPFFGRLARVYHDPNFGYIDISGSIIWDPRRPHHANLVDITPGTRAQVQASDDRVGSPYLSLPAKQKQAPIPYLPEYLYREVLPKPDPTK